MTGQDDLFGQDEARRRDALLALRDVIPQAMHVVVHLRWWKPRDARGASFSQPWAYLVCAAGVHVEDESTWGGWDSRPHDLTTWDELRALLADDPRRAELTDWYHAVPELVQHPEPIGWRASWRDHYRPYELWPQPETWHPSYIEGDHEASGWDARLNAWHTLQAILTDAIARIEGQL